MIAEPIVDDGWRTCWTAAELQRVVFPEPRWAVPGLIAEGVTLIAGPPKVGKSWLGLNLSCAVAQGGKALGRIDVAAGDVLYLALEDNGRRVQSRLQVVMGDEPWPERLSIETSCEALSEGGTERVEAWLDSHPDARLVVVDVLTRIRDRKRDRSSAYIADYDAVAEIKAIADRRSVAFVVVHHDRKAASEDFVDAVSGTHGLAGAADAVMVLARSRGSAEATLKVTGRDIEEAEYALDFAGDVGTWQMLDGRAGDYELGDTRRTILQAVRDSEGMTPSQIAKATGINPNTVKVNVRRMVDDDQLDTNGEGYYFAPPVKQVTPVTDVTGAGDTSYTGYGLRDSFDRQGARDRAAEEVA
jgi:hypothetical protein